MPTDQLNDIAARAGAEHADRVAAILETFPAEAAQEVLNMGARSLDAAIENGATVLRATAPEDEVKRFGETIRKAYSARLILLLAEPAGRG